MAKGYTDEEKANEIERKEQERRKVELADIKALMASDEGKRFVLRLLEFTGVYRSSFTGNSQTFFREGERNVGLFIMSDLAEACPEALTTLGEELLTEKANV